jgi:hypothetical protein
MRQRREARKAELARNDAIVGALCFDEEIGRRGDELGKTERGGECCPLVVLLELGASRRGQLGARSESEEGKGFTIFLAASSLAN